MKQSYSKVFSQFSSHSFLRLVHKYADMRLVFIGSSRRRWGRLMCAPLSVRINRTTLVFVIYNGNTTNENKNSNKAYCNDNKYNKDIIVIIIKMIKVALIV